jgi:hypothetical protein
LIMSLEKNTAMNGVIKESDGTVSSVIHTTSYTIFSHVVKCGE